LIEEKDEVLEALVSEIKVVFQLYGGYKFLESLILNVCLEPTDKVLLSIDVAYVRAYADGVDEQYREFLHSQLEHFGHNVKLQPITEFIRGMDRFRETCERFKQADAGAIADFCNYAFQSHYELATMVKILRRDERSAGPVSSAIKVFFQRILSELYNLNKRNKLVRYRTEDEAILIAETSFSKLYQDMVGMYELIERFLKEQN